jgi:hypothetical protein
MIEDNVTEDSTTMPRYSTTLGSVPLQFDSKDLSITVDEKPFEHPYLPEIWNILLGSTNVGDGAAIDVTVPRDPYVFTHKTPYSTVTMSGLLALLTLYADLFL